MKLQQAYFSESMKAGGWTLIGYAAPNGGETTNFYYGIGSISETGSVTASSATVGWTADNKAKLNDCTKGSATAGKNTNTTANWKVSVTKQGDGGDVSFEAAVNGADCVALTPTFDKIGK